MSDKKEQINDYINKGILKLVDNKIKFNFPFFTYHDFKKVEELTKSSELENAKEKLKDIIKKLSDNMKNYLPNYLEDYTNSLISNQLWNIQGLVLKAFDEAEILDNKEKEDYFPYNLILITSDIDKTYKK
ncbi:unknown [Firmicutes bacterium CAG:313]|nr:unknown [Firmicutes bacterium CAG:313]